MGRHANLSFAAYFMCFPLIHQLRETKATMEAASLSKQFWDVLARVAVAAEARHRHGHDPVPSLAANLLAVSSARCATIGGYATMSVAQGVEFLRHAPTNIGRLRLNGLRRDELRHVIDALADYPCHSFMRTLQLPDTPVDGPIAVNLLAATHGLTHLRCVDVSGAGCMLLVSAARQARHVTIGDWLCATLDLSTLIATNLVVKDCAALQQIVFPPSVTVLGDDAFLNCPVLRRVDLSRTRLGVLDDDFLYDAPSVTEVLLPPSLRVVGVCAFRLCASLRIADLSHTLLETAGDHFFYKCGALTEVRLPPTLTTLGDHAFGMNPSLTRLNLSAVRAVTIGTCFACDCAELAEVALPLSLVTLGRGAFERCHALPAAMTKHALLYLSSD
jgi:hypothetical protein